ncbi:MAG TPA: hypothetical protein VMT52_08955 [Planctomycetota bacterium]|nr:hypothetical protein [Planctomycetota bacterium]
MNLIEIERGASELGRRICANILQSRKRFDLYPEGHPRVVECVQSILSDLRLHAVEKGMAFTIVSPTPSGEASRKGKAAPDDEQVQIGRILGYHFLRSVTILPDVTQRELTEFCASLEADPAAALEKGGLAGLPADHWPHIRLAFYAPRSDGDLSLDAEAPEAPDAPDRVEGARRLEALLEGLREEVRGPLRAALRSPAFLEKCASLQRGLRERTQQSADRGERRIDIFEAVLGSVLASNEVTAAETDPEKILGAMEGVIRFLEENLDVLAAELHTRPGSEDPRVIEEGIGEALRSSSDLANVASTLQAQKEKVAFLFHTFQQRGVQAPAVSDSPAAQAVVPDTASKPFASSAVEGEKESAAAQLEAKFKDIAYDSRGIENRLLEAPAYESYLQVVLELVMRPESEACVVRHAGIVSETLAKKAPSAARLDMAVGEICGFLKETESPLGAEIAGGILTVINSPWEAVRILEEIVLPRGGAELCESFLTTFAGKEPRKALSLLCDTHRSAHPELRRIVEDRLIAMVADQDLLSAWAIEYPEALLKPAVLKKLIKRLKYDAFIRAFRVFFAGASEAEAIRVIASFPSGLRGGEGVLFAAVDAAPASPKRAAIAKFGDYPTPTVISTLSEILKKNNYLPAPDMEEVKAALKALFAMDDDRATALLEEVQRGRGTILHVYRKEIRKALAGFRLLEKERT